LDTGFKNGRGVDGFGGEQNVDGKGLNRGSGDQFMANCLCRLFVMMARRLRGRRHRRAGRNALYAAYDHREGDENNNLSHSNLSVPPSFIRWISPFAGFHEHPRAAIAYAQLR
jgi:hypothetical protein